MELEYSIIKEELLSKGYVELFKGKTDMSVGSVRCISQKEIHHSVLVANQEENLPGKISFQDCAVVCTGRDLAEKVRELMPWSDILLSPDGTSPLEVMAEISGIFQDFSDWIQEMLRCSLACVRLRRFLEVASEKLINPFAVLDSTFRILARSPIPDTLPEGTIWDWMNGENFSMHDYYDADERSMIARSMDNGPYHEVSFHPRRDPDHTYYSILLFVDGHTAGCLGTVDVFSPLTDGQKAIIRIVREMLGEYLKRNRQTLLLEEASSGFWHDLITEGKTDRGEAERMLAKKGWQWTDSYMIVSFLPKDSYYSQIDLAAALNLAVKEFPKAAAAAESRMITLLFRISDYPHDLTAPVRSFADENHLCAGFGFPFPDLSWCGCAFRQSSYAALCARDQNTASLTYQDVQARHVMEAITRCESPQTFCNPVILELARSPKEADRVLVSFLKTYLLNGRNTSDAARSLYLHRNTVTYRLEKLTGMLGTDLRTCSEDQLFSLLISCILAEKLNIDSQ